MKHPKYRTCRSQCHQVQNAKQLSAAHIPNQMNRMKEESVVHFITNIEIGFENPDSCFTVGYHVKSEEVLLHAPQSIRWTRKSIMGWDITNLNAMQSEIAFNEQRNNQILFIHNQPECVCCKLLQMNNTKNVRAEPLATFTINWERMRVPFGRRSEVCAFAK